MAFLRKLKKGGTGRWVVYNAQQNDTIVVPRGFRLRYLAAESLANQTSVGTVSLGVSPATLGVYSYTLTTVTGATAGTINVSGNNNAGQFTLVAADVVSPTATSIAAAIANPARITTAVTGNSTAWNWIITAVGATLYFTQPVGVAGTFTPTLALGSATNITLGAMTVVTAPAVNANVMGPTPMTGPTVAGTVPVQLMTFAGGTQGANNAVFIDGISWLATNADTAVISADKMMGSQAAFWAGPSTSGQLWTLTRTSTTTVTMVGSFPAVQSAVVTSGFSTQTAVATQVGVGSAPLTYATVASLPVATPTILNPLYSPIKPLTIYPGFDICPSTNAPMATLTVSAYGATSAIGSILINGQAINCGTGLAATPAAAATQIALAINQSTLQYGYSAVVNPNVAAQVVIYQSRQSYNKSASQPIYLNTTSMTNITVGSVFAYPADFTYYVNFSTSALNGNVNLYAIMDKID